MMSLDIYALPCYLTVVKSDCWNDYDVNIRMVDMSNEKMLVDIQVPQDKLWMRQSFECRPQQTVRFGAQFTPSIWENEKEKTYSGKRYWSMPTSIDNAAAWSVTLCYPDDFSSVPMPPNATHKCHCDKSVVPPIPDKKSS